MAIYVFNLLVGYLPNGVDNAQGYRHAFLENLNQDVWYVFTQFPQETQITRYAKTGIPIDQMMSPYHFLAGNGSVKYYTTIDTILLDFIKVWSDITVKDLGSSIRVLRQGQRIAEIYLSNDFKNYVSHINYYKNECLIRKEVYTDGLLYTDYFITAKSANGLYAKCVRRSFYQADGAIAYDILFDQNKEYYLFPDGNCYTQVQFLDLFIRKLNFTDQDKIIIDRCATLNFVQPLFEHSQNAKKIAVLHSGHYFEKNQEPSALYLNYEYYYLFKYMDQVDVLIVSTEQQKQELKDKIMQYDCPVPEIQVIPAGALDCLKYPQLPRRPYSLVSVSRLDKRKKVDWVILSVIKAHETNPLISLDIYGSGTKEYTDYLRQLISSHEAEDYIKLMGYQDVCNVYQQYQVYISASLWETLGLSLMEAAGSGNAFIGLDVMYGNRVFIKSDENGYLVDFTYDYVSENQEELIAKIADRIVEIFSDMERLQRFSERSYEIAQQFLKKDMYIKWKQLLD